MGLYVIQVGVNGASTGYSCNVTFTSGTMSDGAGQCLPTQTAYTYMSFQGGIGFQVPAGDAYCGGTVSATSSVAGSILVSPPVNVPTTVTLWGRGGVIGTYSLPAGQESGQFNFAVTSAEGIPPEEVADTINQFVKRSA
jgi:hypothetical protein